MSKPYNMDREARKAPQSRIDADHEFDPAIVIAARHRLPITVARWALENASHAAKGD
jgi:hypothetical protein